MKKAFFNSTLHAIISGVSIILIILVVLFSGKTGQVDIAVGEVSPEDIYASRAVVDTVTTTANRKAARKSVENAYVVNDDKRLSAVESISDFFALATSFRDDEDKSDSAAQAFLQAQTKLDISDSAARTVINADESDFREMGKAGDIVDEIMTQGISDISEANSSFNEKADKLNLSSAQKYAIEEIASLVMTQNLDLDEAETERRRDAAAESVSEIVYEKGRIIVRKGEIVSEAQLEMLRQLGLLKGSNPISISYIFGVIILIIIFYIIIALFYVKQEKRTPYSIPIASLMGLIVTLMVFYGSKLIPSNLMPILPIGLFPGIVAIFATSQLSIISNLALSIFCAIAFDADWSYAVSLIVAGTLTAFCFSAVKRRNHLLPASIISSLFYGLAFCSMSLIESSSAFSAFASFAKGFVGGFISGLITIGSLPLIEWLFNATTPMKLSELANPENKLLKKLLVEAPGTYHHSLTVANISEIAARSIHADSLLARVGAYYHDIGKLRHPLYFKENQYDKNIHDTLSPQESSQVIISHVTDGVEIATKNRLPQTIIDIIGQHHGKTTTGYFLIRAKELGEVDESKFTYPGPVPHSKEAAIVMLADSCEAAVRSIEDKTEGKIESMVRKIATERVNSGQFSQCNMTFEELETVIRVITKTLGGYFHERVKYE
ncbi:MAG: HDIG domain-containing protein [Clostridia bacterium]|nr:HDIG domain-containing protein [Clostridia bacterium]